MVARMGGDEFVLVLPGIQDNEDALRVTDTIHAALQEPCQLSPTVAITLSAAMGIALYPDDGKLEDELLNAADERMYSNKREGGRRDCDRNPMSEKNIISE